MVITGSWQVQGKDRALVADIARQLGMEGSYIPRSYIEQVTPTVQDYGRTSVCSTGSCAGSAEQLPGHLLLAQDLCR